MPSKYIKLNISITTANDFIESLTRLTHEKVPLDAPHA